MTANLMMWLIIAIVPLCGAICAFTPFFMPRSECFAVTVPEAAQADTRLKNMKRTYCVAVLLITGACTAIVARMLPGIIGRNDISLFTLVYAAATLLPLVIGFALMLTFRKRVQALKTQEGWVVQQQLAASVVAGSADIPKPLSMGWSILYVPALIAVAVLIYVLYPLMPEQIPMNVDLSGNVTSSVVKTPLSASFPLFIGVFIAAVFVFCNWSILRSKRPIDPKRAASSAYAYGSFAKVMSVAMLACGLVLTAAIGMLIPLATVGVLTMMQAALSILAIAIAIVAAVLIASFRYGQSGARVFEGAKDSKSMARDDDRFWKLGVFYVNAEDPAIFVPKRFGFGWTCNFARPATWIILVGFVVFIAAFLGLISTLFR